MKNALLFTVSLLIGAVASSQGSRPFPAGLFACCGGGNGGYNCNACPTYNCCVTTCTAAKSGGNAACALINCPDQCASVFGQ